MTAVRYLHHKGRCDNFCQVFRQEWLVAFWHLSTSLQAAENQRSKGLRGWYDTVIAALSDIQAPAFLIYESSQHRQQTVPAVPPRTQAPTWHPLLQAMLHLCDRGSVGVVSTWDACFEQLGQVQMRFYSLSLSQGSVFSLCGPSWFSFFSPQCVEGFCGIFCCYIVSFFLFQPENMSQYETDQEASWGMKGTLQCHFHSIFFAFEDAR